MINRCPWTKDDAQMNEYHDTEWGVPVHDDDKLFEFIVLDTFQAGLSWQIVLRKRENFRKAFAEFNAEKIARFNEKKVAALLLDEGIIRNKAKIIATIDNAKIFLELKKTYGSFDAFIWKFTKHKTVVNKWKALSEIPTHSLESDAMSAELKKLGFRFAGTTICYAFMQAAGMINDHLVTCPRHKQVISNR
jgi:DNA-3-methyladenine glycosylase I